MPTTWTCPDPACPTTERPPIDVTSQGDETRTALCGECGATFPTSAIRRTA